MKTTSVVRSLLAMALVFVSSSTALAQQLGPGSHAKPETGAKTSDAPTGLTVLTGAKRKCVHVLGRAPLVTKCRPIFR